MYMSYFDVQFHSDASDDFISVLQIDFKNFIYSFIDIFVLKSTFVLARQECSRCTEMEQNVFFI